MKKIEGLSASRGIVIGPVFCLANDTPVSIPRYRITEKEAEVQWLHFESALEKSKKEILLLKDTRNKDQSEILEAHLMMLSDPEFIPQIKKSLFTELINIEAVLKDKIDETSGMLRTTGDSYLAERAVDIEDAFGRVLGHLLQNTDGSKGGTSSNFIPPGAILVARNIKPSDAFTLKDSGISGIILEEGGATSHVAILARAARIPAVMGVTGILDILSDGEEIILDATDGFVITEATNDLVSLYRSRQKTSLRLQAETAVEHSTLIHARSETADGTVIGLRANIAYAEEAIDALEEGAEGVGLFRSEFLFLGTAILPGEEVQFEAYRTTVENMNGLPVVIRTLDAGADKMIAEQIELGEKNPLLGWRAVRYCLDRREFFKIQLRALLRASYFGDLRIMFPMISGVDELDAVLDVLEEAKAECVQEGLPFNRNIKIGIMIEIPAAAVCADFLAKKVDFMSIGTNDLIQYTMAVDRENPKVAHLYDCYNPAVLRLIRQTIEAGLSAGTEVSMCGEMAGNPGSVFLLLGIGLRCFSMTPPLIAPVKELIRKISLSDAKELADAAFELSAAREIRKLIQGKLKTYE